MLRPYYIPSWVYFFIGAAIAVALFFGIYSFAFLEGIPQFIGVSNAESGDTSLPDFSSVLLAGCTTKTVGIQTRKFKGTTTIATGCPDSRNVCSEFICNDERICEEVLVTNATCSEDFDCDLFERCDTATCSCVPDGTQCTEDSQCLNVNMTSVCTETFCDVDQGQCKTRFINEVVDSCETDNNCADGFICRDCLCIMMPEVNVTACTMDSDCTDFSETSSCIESFCNMTTMTCATTFQDMSFDCDGSCPSGQVCQDCVCRSIGEVQCNTSDDCINITTSSCVESFCDVDKCATRFINDTFNCDGSCSVNEVCQDCICVPLSSGDTFPDNTFRIFDEINNDAQIAFDASSITPATTRTLTVQDQDGTIALLSDTWVLAYTGTLDFETNINTNVFSTPPNFSMWRSGTLRTLVIDAASGGSIGAGASGIFDDTSIQPADSYAGQVSTILNCFFDGSGRQFSTLQLLGTDLSLFQGVDGTATGPINPIFCNGGSLIYDVSLDP